MKHWIAGIAVVVAALASNARANLPPSVSVLAPACDSAADSATRKQLVDNALGKATHTSGRILRLRDLDGSLVLRSMDAESVTLGACDSPNILINPEPSSFLVWSVLAIGVAAAGNGFRQRFSTP